MSDAEKKIMEFIREDPNLAFESLKEILLRKTKDCMNPNGEFTPQEKINAIAFLPHIPLEPRETFQAEIAEVMRKVIKYEENGGVISAAKSVLEKMEKGRLNENGLWGGDKALEEIVKKLADVSRRPEVTQRRIARTFSRL